MHTTVAYLLTDCRAATASFWQARPPHQQRAAAASTAFYSAKSRQGLGLGGRASHGSPELTYKMTDLCLVVYQQTCPFINRLFF